MGYERLTVVDASFLHIETAHEPQHVGALLYLDDGPLRTGGDGCASTSSGRWWRDGCTRFPGCVRR